MGLYEKNVKRAGCSEVEKHVRENMEGNLRKPERDDVHR